MESNGLLPYGYIRFILCCYIADSFTVEDCLYWLYIGVCRFNSFFILNLQYSWFICRANMGSVYDEQYTQTQALASPILCYIAIGIAIVGGIYLCNL
jgi:hypothetical protein